MSWLPRVSVLLIGVLNVLAGSRPHIVVRGIYGGVPVELLEGGKSLGDAGVNAVWISSTALTAERVTLLRRQGVRIFAEFNSMHVAEYVHGHPDAAPVGADGQVCLPPDGWQGVCPSHPGYRKDRMQAFRSTLESHDIDGIWLDYHHSHAAWERAEPLLPDTCFCARCVTRFQQDTGTKLPGIPVDQLSALLLGRHRDRWLRWRADLFTDWVREYREVLDRTRPGQMLGTFHCPWSDRDFEGTLYDRLAIDLKAQSRYLDVLSPMPYHARFGHVADPAWISRQTSWLGRYLGLRGGEGEKPRIWPIVQLSDWGEPVDASQVREVLDHGSRLPATGVIVFAWGGLRASKDKIAEMVAFFREIRP